MKVCFERPRLRLVVCLLAMAGVLGGGLSLAVGQPVFAPLVQRERTVLVLVDVRVQDPQGRPVRGLEAKDFLLRIDGRYVPVASFDEISLPAIGPVAADATSAAEHAPRAASSYFVFFFDYVMSNHFERRQAARAADRMLRDVLERGDRFTAVVLGRRFKVVSPMSTVDERGFDRFERLLADPEILEPYADQREARVEELRQILEDNPDNPEKARVVARAYATEEGNRVHEVLEAVRTLLAALEPIRERKHLVYFSSGVPQSPGAQYLAEVGLTDEIFGGTRRTQFAVRQLFREANSGRISIFPVDLAGMERTRPVDRLTGAKDGLISLALNTGGKAILGTNDLSGAIGEAVAASRHYYLLGFTPASGGDGDYHAIDVQVRNPQWKVLARSGFMDFTASQMEEREVLGSFVLPEMYRELPVRLEIVPVERRGKSWIAEVQVRVPIERLDRLPQGDGAAGQLEIGGSVFRGAILSSRFDRAVTMRFPEAEVTVGDIVLQETVEIKPGGYQGIAVVRDVVGGQLGGARLDMELPEPRRGALQVALGKRAGKDILAPPPQGSPPAKHRRLVAGDHRVIWRAEGDVWFEATDVLVVAYLLAGRGAGSTVPTHVLQQDGRLVRTSSPRLTAVGRKGRDAAAYEEIVAADLAPGRYSLRIVDEGRSGSSEQVVRFGIRGPEHLPSGRRE